MGDIGGAIAMGALGALGHILGLIPWQAWGMLAICVVAALFVVRYVTDWHVVIPVIVGFFIFGQIVAWRAHWIDLGKADVEAKYAKLEAQDKAKASQALVREQGFRQTEGLIEACYAQNTRVSYLWDRTVGKCLREDGASVRFGGLRHR